MGFPESIIKEAWQRANGRCECRRKEHNHLYIRCNKELVWENRGRENGRGAWEAHHRISVESGGDNTLSNCEILCWDCHSKTL
ncbi:MAG: HNH endonuclease signature motif containing protein [Elusimicrobiota bacterium]